MGKGSERSGKDEGPMFPPRQQAQRNPLSYRVSHLLTERAGGDQECGDGVTAGPFQ